MDSFSDNMVGRFNLIQFILVHLASTAFIWCPTKCKAFCYLFPMGREDEPGKFQGFSNFSWGEIVNIWGFVGYVDTGAKLKSSCNRKATCISWLRSNKT